MLIPLFLMPRDDIAQVKGEVADMRAVQSEQGERLARPAAGQGALRGDLAATDERMARIEGAAAGALGRSFPERMAQAPGVEASGGAGG